MSAPDPSVLAALESVWQHCVQLPDDESAFAALTPDERRAAHDLGVRCQDRLLRTLSRLVMDMGTDGADLVDDFGLPDGYQDPEPTQ